MDEHVTVELASANAQRVAAAIQASERSVGEVADRAGIYRMVLRRHLAAPARSPLEADELESLEKALDLPAGVLALRSHRRAS